MAGNLITGPKAKAIHSAVKTWLNSCTELPTGISVSFEDLPENAVGICFSTDQSPVYATRYITGGYRAQYLFQVIYRVLPSDDSDMLDAVDVLTDISAWCETAAPPVIENAVNIRVERTSDVAVIAVYEDGTSDYGCGITITWEEF